MNEAERAENYVRRIYRWRLAFFSLVILLAGLVIGSAATVIFTRNRLAGPPRPPRVSSERMLRRLEHTLQLESEQVDRIRVILNRHMQALRDIRENARRTVDEQLAIMNEEVSSVLDEHQKSLWQRHLHRLRERIPPRHQRRHRGQRPGHPNHRPPAPNEHRVPYEQPPPPTGGPQ